jgi:hypothetical protein
VSEVAVGNPTEIMAARSKPNWRWRRRPSLPLTRRSPTAAADVVGNISPPALEDCCKIIGIDTPNSRKSLTPRAATSSAPVRSETGAATRSRPSPLLR